MWRRSGAEPMGAVAGAFSQLTLRDVEAESTRCVLDRYISDLNVDVTNGGLSASPWVSEGFAYLWGGVKATYGVARGKVCFQVKLERHLNVSHLPSEEPNKHVVRVGWSTREASLQLGEDLYSYGYGGTAKMSFNGQFHDYGETFRAGDVITSCLDMEGGKPTISYYKNGKNPGVAFNIQDNLKGRILFPHLLLKNTVVSVDFGQRDRPYFPAPVDYTFIGAIPVRDRVRGPVAPATKNKCEVLMMVGLPGAGKSTWVEKHCREYPEKKYYILGTNHIMNKMKVMGLVRKRNYMERWDVLFQKANECLKRFLEKAGDHKRNFIIDQTNVYPSARRRKMGPFRGFTRKAIVVTPNDEEFQRRVGHRAVEENKTVPESEVLKMKANFKLPTTHELFDECIFVELGRTDADQLVRRYNRDGLQRRQYYDDDW